MKLILTAINAKYIHSNLAVYSLKTYAQAYQKEETAKNLEIQIKEFTINHQLDDILEELYCEKPDILCFSCYIWNISYVTMLIKELGQLLPQTDIWVGGPEVSYDAQTFLETYPQVKGVMIGEGEEIFKNVCDFYGTYQEELEHICGIAFLKKQNSSKKDIDVRNVTKKYIETMKERVLDLSKVPFPYAGRKQTETGIILEPAEIFTHLKNRIVYYESSRGCPFSCSYCLSSVDKTLRFRDLKLVKEELQFFIDQEVPQVKFVDRTFNCKKSHAIEIWNYILEHDKGKTNFHFEIGADLLGEEELALFQKMRPGLIQLEIGVQSTNESTILEVARKTNLEKLAQTVQTIRSFRNINLHLDLIAGLPYEDLKTFEKSFADVYHMYPDQLQLGFLKVLKGSAMQKKAGDYGLVTKHYPPYEVLYTNWLSYEDVLVLKLVEEMVEKYYNSGQFPNSLRYLEEYFSEPFSMFLELGNYYRERFPKKEKQGRIALYDFLLEFFTKKVQNKQQEVGIFKELLTYDLYLRENMKTRPVFAGEVSTYRNLFREISRQCGHQNCEHVEIFSANTVEILKSFGIMWKTLEIKVRNVENFCMTEAEGAIMVFNYGKRNPLNYNAGVVEIDVVKE